MTETHLGNAVAVVPRAVPLRTYIAVTFWGEEYRQYFLKFSLASLMSPNNIPAIQDKNGARLLIATRDDDWRALQSDPIFVAARQHITIEHVLHEAPLDVTNSNKMFVMSQGHKLLTRRMFEDRAQGVMIYPDVVFADGAIRRIEQLALSGYKVVLCIAVRFANEGLIDELERLGRVGRGMPIVVDAKELARLTINHIHSETTRCEFDADLDDQGVCSFFWIVRPGQDLLFHCANWAPLLLDYSSLSHHDNSTFDKWTFDGDYVARNFSDVNDIYVVRDTAELFVSGFTAESKVGYRQVHLFPYRFSGLRAAIKIMRAREHVDRHGILDDVKKEFFRVPIRVRGGASSEDAWRAAERQAALVVGRISEPSKMLAVSCFCWSIIRGFASLGRRLLLRLRESRRRSRQLGF